MNVLGIKLEHFEKSRASKVNCINHKVPDQCLNLLKSDSERRKSVIEYQNAKNSKGNPSGFLDSKEKEFEAIQKRIEKQKIHRLEQANQELGPTAVQADVNRKQTTGIEKQIKQAQKEMD